jgi:hypothetical protein
VVIDNRPGAGGVIGTDSVAKAVPDGYTLMIGATSTLAANPSLYTKMNLDPTQDLTPITQIASGPFVLAVPLLAPRHGASRSLSLFAKAKPGELNYGSSGIGSSLQLTAELFKTMARVDIVHVPYKGPGPCPDRPGRRSHPDHLLGHGGPAAVRPVRTVARPGRHQRQALVRPSGPADARGSRRGGLRGDLLVWRAGPEGNAGRYRGEAQWRIGADRAQSRDEGEVREASASSRSPIRRKRSPPFIRSEMDKWRIVVTTAGIKVD